VLGAQLIFGVMFGILGLVLADPIVAMLKIALERQAERNTADPDASTDNE
jgi:predicted PurR-regulated permease PerM